MIINKSEWIESEVVRKFQVLDYITSAAILIYSLIKKRRYFNLRTIDLMLLNFFFLYEYFLSA